ncbi:UPF0761 membrane protein [Planktothrix tepida]|uniref:Ribonuclease BN n=1 Tax=Planktothrix tepida PCC 9214 TaxID=671072 RepID=A0A1J1LUS9_9CYAN|nr:YihY/virulence factor BrkB family protein [Planktothrix tepida]CAD5982394.1 UPF0761 membrane protein [Planktothrix tepida]CUR35778.1 Ribonuclease BN [Planktothrix tepida PCC 9214]
MVSWRTVWRLLKETYQEWSQDNASQLAAALAYYTVFSLAPLLVIVVAIAGFFLGEEAARGELVGQIQGLVGKDGATVIQTALENTNRPGEGNGIFASLVSLGFLIFGASGVFVQLQDSLNTIWNITAKPTNAVGSFVRKRALSFAAVISIGFLLLVSLTVSAVLTGLSHYASELLPGADSLWQLLNLIVSFAVTTLLFALIFKYLPDVLITWNDVLIGAMITALFFTLGKSLIGMYLGSSSFSSTYGAAGSLVIFLTWIYYSVQILFFGAEFTQVYTRHYGSNIIPDRHAEFKS